MVESIRRHTVFPAHRVAPRSRVETTTTVDALENASIDVAEAYRRIYEELQGLGYRRYSDEEYRGRVGSLVKAMSRAGVDIEDLARYRPHAVAVLRSGNAYAIQVTSALGRNKLYIARGMRGVKIVLIHYNSLGEPARVYTWRSGERIGVVTNTLLNIADRRLRDAVGGAQWFKPRLHRL